MHDIDRTQLEAEWEIDPYGSSEFESEYELEYDDEFESEFEYEDELEAYQGMNGQYMASEYEHEFGYENIFDEAEEMELAAELLEVMDDEELEQFLGKLIKRASRKVKKAVRGRAGRFLKRGLRGLAKKALPIAGGAVGSLFGGPAGGAIGSRLASRAGSLFGLELEGLSPEDQEYEVARRYVRLAGDAAKKAAMAPASAPPQIVAKKAIASAAKKHAPGLVATAMRKASKGRGMWKRKGNSIVLYNVY